jgi:hypothetical protein
VHEANAPINERGVGWRFCAASTEMRMYRGYEEDREGMQRKREGKKQLVASGKSKALRWGVLSKE